MKLFVAEFLCFFGIINCQSPQIRVEQGELTGTTYTLRSGRTVSAFLGIPYAVPLTYKNRFKEPQILKPWPGVWNASTYPPPCLQYLLTTYSIVGEEDCLYLNVYTPKLPENGVSPMLDVLVYIHGGGFMHGNGQDIRPDYVMKDENIVVVTLNYRLGILGFLSTGDSFAPGNNGLKDQAAALRWVHNNIVQFGGNPASVTISGGSAGGASVHYHMLSPMSDGLFQKAISFSGSTLPPWTLPRNNTEKSIHLATLVGCPTDVTKDMIKCLSQRPAKQLVEMMKNFMTWRYCPFTAFGPTVEPVTVNNFLVEEPLELLKTGRVKNIPWLVSLVEKEGMYPAADFVGSDESLAELNDNWNDIAPHLLMYNFSVSSDVEKNKVSTDIREFYLGSRPISKNTITEVVQALGDRFFYNDIIRALKLHAAGTNTKKAFCYKFTYRGKYSFTSVYSKPVDIDYGAAHGDDMYYIFKFFPYDFDETPADTAVTDLMRSVVISFVKTGTPSLSNAQWEPISPNLGENLRCLEIKGPNDQPVMTELDNQKTIEFWRNLLPSEYSTVDEIVSPPNDEL